MIFKVWKKAVNNIIYMIYHEVLFDRFRESKYGW